ncbi:hypothetical protein ACU4GD_44305 [Cupriavidus basilensis]
MHLLLGSLCPLLRRAPCAEPHAGRRGSRTVGQCSRHCAAPAGGPAEPRIRGQTGGKRRWSRCRHRSGAAKPRRRRKPDSAEQRERQAALKQQRARANFGTPASHGQERPHHRWRGQPCGTGAGAGGAASPGYADRVRRRVKPEHHLHRRGGRQTRPRWLRCNWAPTGPLPSARLTKSSGNAVAGSNAVLRAVAVSDPTRCRA